VRGVCDLECLGMSIVCISARPSLTAKQFSPPSRPPCLYLVHQTCLIDTCYNLCLPLQPLRPVRAYLHQIWGTSMTPLHWRPTGHAGQSQLPNGHHRCVRACVCVGGGDGQSMIRADDVLILTKLISGPSASGAMCWWF
jgi:hypothetical protein